MKTSFLALVACIAVLGSLAGCHHHKHACRNCDEHPVVLPLSGDSCDVAIDPLPLGETVTGTLVGAHDDMVAPCNAATHGPDVVYKLELDEDAGVEIAVQGDNGFDPVVYLMNAPCGIVDAVAGACSDIPGTSELLQIGMLAAGEYFIAVDAVDVAGAVSPGSFSLTVQTMADGVCVKDDFERSGFGQNARAAVALGAGNLDTAAESVSLRLCGTAAERYYSLGHMGGLLTAAITGGVGATAEIYQATPDLTGIVDADVSDIPVDQGAWVGTLPFSGTLAAGMYLIKVSGSSPDVHGIDYGLQIGHDCLADVDDSPLALLDDNTPARARFTWPLQPSDPIERGVCATDVDTFLVTSTLTGNVVATLANAAGLAVTASHFDPAAGTSVGVAANVVPNGADVTVTIPAATAGTYAIAVAGVAGSLPIHLHPYTFAATVPADASCALAADLDVATNPVAGTTLGAPDRNDPAGATLGPTSCTGYAEPGPDQVYAITVPLDSTLTLGLTADFDAALYVINGCPGATACLAGVDADHRNDTNVEQLTVAGHGSILYVVVDSRARLARGHFELSWAIEAPAPLAVCGNGSVEAGEQCDDSQLPPQDGDGCSASCTVELGYDCSTGVCLVVNALTGDDSCPAGTVNLPLPGRHGDAAFMVSATAANATDSLAGTCGGNFGPELIYTLVATEDATYRIRTMGGDTVVYAFTGVCGASVDEVACNDDSPNALDGGSEVALTVQNGQTYFIVIDFFQTVPPDIEVTVGRL